MTREQTQYYFKCSSCRWFGPLTTDELASVRVGNLGTSRCPRCGQIGFLDPTPPRQTRTMTWLVVGAVAAVLALVAVFTP